LNGVGFGFCPYSSFSGEMHCILPVHPHLVDARFAPIFLWTRIFMTPLKSGRPYELVFGPGIDLGPGEQSEAIDLVYRQVSEIDGDAITMSVASEGLKVIGSELLGAIDAGRQVCTLRCRVYDRQSGAELSTEAELARSGPRERVSASKAGAFDARSGQATAPRKQRGAFGARSRSYR
jgi:hypothetical protein